MNVIAHRGLWVGSALGNSWEALVSAMDQGFDIELDVRDHCGEVVIEHDPAFKDPLPLEKIFKRAVMYEASRKLYLNIKADGLAPLLASLSESFPECSFTTFDHSVPDLLSSTNLPFLVRHSEFEDARNLVNRLNPDGVWLDSFVSNRPVSETITEVREFWEGEIVVVSEELHGREHSPQWEQIPKGDKNLSICTDLVREAVDYFAGI